MVEAYVELVQRARDWFERAAAGGWFGESERRRFMAVEQATPADLFAADQVRPLVIALFGGTGVGKSSLLNRLAGAALARVGPERPTSRDVTLYVHESVRLADLPAELPLDRVRTQRHHSAAHHDVLWIDAPDIDSTDETNQRCAFSWLPHIDLLCYVVSPERYRDDAGWRVLRERGHKHGWMFVMNRWDEGDPRQCEDFLGMLHAAGFDHPLLWRTCCTDAAVPTPDEFGEIQSTLQHLQQAHAVRELTRLGHRARVQQLRGAIEELQARFGGEAEWGAVAAALEQRWQHTRTQLLEGTAWAMPAIAARFAVREGGVLAGLGERVVALSGKQRRQEQAPAELPGAGELDALTGPLWDDWSQAKLASYIDAVELAAGRAGLATLPLRRKLDEVSQGARASVTTCVQDGVRAALVRPGSVLARIGRRATGFLTAALPIGALGWVGYELLVGYYRATMGRGPFLGSSFAVHSALLVLVAWAVPFLLDRMLRPSLEKAIFRALERGFGSGVDALAGRSRAALADSRHVAGQYAEQAQELTTTAARLMLQPVDPHDPTLARLLLSVRMRMEPEPATSGSRGQ